MGQKSGFISRLDDGYHELVTDQLIAHVDRNRIRRRMNDVEDNVEQPPQFLSDEWNSRNVGKGHNGPSIVRTSMLWQPPRCRIIRESSLFKSITQRLKFLPSAAEG